MMTATTATLDAETVTAAQPLDADELVRYVFRDGWGERGRPWLQPGQVVAETVAGWWLVYGQVEAEVAARLATGFSSNAEQPADQWRHAKVEPPVSVVFTWHKPGCGGGPDCHAGCYDGEGWWVNEVPPGTPGSVVVTPVAPVPCRRRPGKFSRLLRHR